MGPSPLHVNIVGLYMTIPRAMQYLFLILIDSALQIIGTDREDR